MNLWDDFIAKLLLLYFNCESEIVYELIIGVMHGGRTATAAGEPAKAAS